MKVEPGRKRASKVKKGFTKERAQRQRLRDLVCWFQIHTKKGSAALCHDLGSGTCLLGSEMRGRDVGYPDRKLRARARYDGGSRQRSGNAEAQAPGLESVLVGCV